MPKKPTRPETSLVKRFSTERTSQIEELAALVSQRASVKVAAHQIVDEVVDIGMGVFRQRLAKPGQ